MGLLDLDIQGERTRKGLMLWRGRHSGRKRTGMAAVGHHLPKCGWCQAQFSKIGCHPARWAEPRPSWGDAPGEPWTGYLQKTLKFWLILSAVRKAIPIFS